MAAGIDALLPGGPTNSTPFHLAARFGHSGVLDFLLSTRVDVEAKLVCQPHSQKLVLIAGFAPQACEQLEQPANLQCFFRMHMLLLSWCGIVRICVN